MSDNGGGLWSRILAVPVLALFLGVAILAGRMAYDWTPTLSEQVVGGVLTACGGGIALFGVAAGAIVGLAFVRRYTHSQAQEDELLYQRRQKQMPGAWPGAGAGNGSYYLPPPRMTEPPVVEAPQGSWSSPGPAVYRHPADIDYGQDIGPVKWGE